MKLYRTGLAKRVVLVAAAVLVFLAAGGLMFFRSLSYVATDDAYIEGRIHSIAAKIPGTVGRVLVADNQPVKKGDVLVEIDPVDYEVQVKEAEAALAAEQGRVTEAETRQAAAAAGLEVQEATLKQAVLDAVRAERLFAAGAFPKEKLEKSQTALALARAGIKAAQEAIRQAEAARTLAAALVSQREAALERARLNLGYTKITAPADGMVTKKSVEAGNQVQAGQPLMAVVDLTDVWITANYKETQLRDVRPGMEVAFVVDTYGRRQFKGTVDSLMAGTGSAFSLFPPENALGNYVKVVQRIPVKIVIDRQSAEGYALRVGMSVVPRIKVK